MSVAAPPVVIRTLTPADRHALLFLFAHLTPESRYQRFLGAKRELRPRELARLVEVDHWHREALIAWSAPPRRPVAIARYERGERFDCAELAVAVVDGWQRQGVGYRVMLDLRRRCAAAGIQRFSATMLSGNRGALALVRRLGLELSFSYHTGVVELTGTWRQ